MTTQPSATTPAATRLDRASLTGRESHGPGHGRWLTSVPEAATHSEERRRVRSRRTEDARHSAVVKRGGVLS